MKNDLERGAEDLETYGYMFKAIGAVLYGCVGGALIVHGSYVAPKSFFWSQAFVGVLLLLSALIYPFSSE